MVWNKTKGEAIKSININKMKGKRKLNQRKHGSYVVESFVKTRFPKSVHMLFFAFRC